jgi:hypothetical protein
MNQANERNLRYLEREVSKDVKEAQRIVNKKRFLFALFKIINLRLIFFYIFN